MDPDEISRQLKIEAEHCFKAGEPRHAENGSPKGSPQDLQVRSSPQESRTDSPAGGSPRHATASHSTPSVHAETYWLATLNPAWWPMQGGFAESADETRMTNLLHRMATTMLGPVLSACASRFLRPHAEFFSRLQTEGGQVRLLVEVNTAVVDGFTLTPELGREMNALTIPIDFEFTPP
jgi:hypothetical protein